MNRKATIEHMHGNNRALMLRELRRGGMMRPALICAMVVMTLASVTASGAQEPPWSEQAVQRHLDFDTVAAETAASGPAALIAEGERLFTAKFTRFDGVGRPMATQASIPTKRRRPAESAFVRTSGPDATACVSCHADPSPGGAGDFTVNAFVSEGFTSAEFDSLDPQFSNERGTTALFGAGLIELLAREMTAELQAQRNTALSAARATGEAVSAALSTKGVGFGALTAAPDGTVDVSGVEGVDPDLVIRPFGQKGVSVSLRQFTVSALNAHHGIQAEERFGARWTGEADFDEDGVAAEFTAGDVSALVAFQAVLAPLDRFAPSEESWRAAADAGATLFEQWGCVDCHRPALPLTSLRFADPGPFDTAGTLRAADVGAAITLDLGELDWVAKLPRNAVGDVLVPLFGDLKRHVIAGAAVSTFGNELLAQNFVERNMFMTAELWGVAATAPYGHRGDMTVLDEAIRAHGGEGRASRERYVEATDASRAKLVAFLRTMGAAP
ncbi:MAG: hypothetical protein OEQ29_14635 [Alphaproteobacteria bacterium]|nr:hypothetical protein [Alphaproteobacteria bacterium]